MYFMVAMHIRYLLFSLTFHSIEDPQHHFNYEGYEAQISNSLSQKIINTVENEMEKLTFLLNNTNDNF